MNRKRYRIVIGLDLTEYCEIVLEHALDQAARHEAPEMHFLFVKEKKQKRRATEELQQRLASVVYPALQTFNRFGTDWRARLHVRSGRPDEQISALAQDLQADLIVMGQFGLHTRGESLKTLPSRVLQAAPCPTLVVGMPHALQQPMCFACARIREETEAEQWFCEEHRAVDRIEHDVTPMTVWTGGSVMW